MLVKVGRWLREGWEGGKCLTRYKQRHKEGREEPAHKLHQVVSAGARSCTQKPGAGCQLWGGHQGRGQEVLDGQPWQKAVLCNELKEGSMEE